MFSDVAGSSVHAISINKMFYIFYRCNVIAQCLKHPFFFMMPNHINVHFSWSNKLQMDKMQCPTLPLFSLNIQFHIWKYV